MYISHLLRVLPQKLLITLFTFIACIAAINNIFAAIIKNQIIMKTSKKSKRVVKLTPLCETAKELQLSHDRLEAKRRSAEKSAKQAERDRDSEMGELDVFNRLREAHRLAEKQPR